MLSRRNWGISSVRSSDAFDSMTSDDALSSVDERIPDDVLSDLLTALRQQMESDETAFVRCTFERLTAAGCVEDEALHAMASVLLWEINTMMATQSPFDLDHYRSELDALSFSTNS